MAIKVTPAKGKPPPNVNIIDVLLKRDWQGKCPLCGKDVKVIWESPDEKVKAYQCVKGHSKKGVKDHPVWLVRE